MKYSGHFNRYKLDNSLLRMVKFVYYVYKKPDVKYQHTALPIRAKYLWPSSGYMNCVLLVKRIEYLCIIVVVKTTVRSP